MATFYTGNSGRSTGPHLDFRVWSHETEDYVDPTSFSSYVTSGDGGLDQFRQTSPYGENRSSYIHRGVDYATEMGTPINVNGRYLTTWDDKGGGGITSQYEIDHDGGKYDILLMHGNDQNKVLSQAAVTDGVSLAPNSSFTPPETPQQADGSPQRVEAATRAKEYSKMNKAEMNSAYGDLRKSDPAKAAIEGKKMHRAFFNK